MRMCTHTYMSKEEFLMKRWLNILLAFAMLIPTQPAFVTANAADNAETVGTLVNGDFENGIDGWNINVGGEGAFVAESDAVYYGTGAIRKNTSGLSKLCQVVKVKKNTKYLFSVYAKVPGSYVQILASRANGMNNTLPLGGENLIYTGTAKAVTTISEKSTEWKRYGLVFDSGDNEYIALVIQADFTGTANAEDKDFVFDRANLVEISNVVNGDFEDGMSDWNMYEADSFSAVEDDRNAGAKVAKMVKSGTHRLYQVIPVERNTDYLVSAYVKFSPATDTDYCQLGVFSQSKLDEKKFTLTNRLNNLLINTKVENWKRKGVKFNSGDNDFIAVSIQSTVNNFYVGNISIRRIDNALSGSFENGVSDLYDWNVTNGEWSIGSDAYEGTAALKKSAGSLTKIYQCVTVEKNKTYILSAYAKIPNGGYMQMFANKASDVSDAVLPLGGNNKIGSASTYNAANLSWKKYSHVFNSGDNEYAAMLIQADFGSEATKYEKFVIDNIELKMVDLKIDSVTIDGYVKANTALKAECGNVTLNVADAESTSVKYQWQSSADGAAWTNIEGENSEQYCLGASPAAQIRVVATPTAVIDGTEISGTSVTSAAVTSDGTAFEASMKTKLEGLFAQIDSEPWKTDDTYLGRLQDSVARAEEYGIDYSKFTGFEKYNNLLPNLTEVKSVTAVAEGTDIVFNIEFTTPANPSEITKDNIKVLCGTETVDYSLESVNSGAAAKVTFANKLTGGETYRLYVKAGLLCNYGTSLEVSKPVTAKDIAIYNSEGSKVESISEITDGRMTVKASVVNNTFTSVNADIITAVYDENGLLRTAQTQKASNASKGTELYTETQLSIPADGSVTSDWKVSVFVWNNLKPLTGGTTAEHKSYGLDVLNDDAKSLKVAFIGGSITQGKGYSTPLVEAWNKARTGEVSEINAGAGGTGSNYGALRLNEEVLAKKPDVVFVEFTLNDLAINGDIKANVESIIRQAHDMQHQPVVMFIHVPDRRMSGESYLIQSRVDDYDEVLATYGLKALNVHNYFADKVAAGELAWTDILPADVSNVHPTAEGGQKIADYIWGELSGANKGDYLKNIVWRGDAQFGATAYASPNTVDSSFGIYDGNWTVSEPSGAVEEGYNTPISQNVFNTFYSTDKKGARMEFSFSGKLIAVTSLIGDGGGKAMYTITNADGTEINGEMSNYYQGSPWYKRFMLIRNDLPDGAHTITIETAESGKTFGIGQFWVDER